MLINEQMKSSKKYGQPKRYCTAQIYKQMDFSLQITWAILKVITLNKRG